MATDGTDFVEFLQRLLRYFQQKMLLNFGVGEGNKSNFSLEELESLINLLIRASKQGKETEIDQLPLELAIVDFIGESNKKDTVLLKKSDKEEVIEKPEEIKIEIKEEKIITLDVLNVDLEKIVQSWGNIMLTVKPFNHSVEAFLRAARPIKLQGRTLILEVFYPFHKDRLEEPRNKKIVEDSILKVLGIEMGLSCVLSKSKKEPLVIKNDTPVENISDQLVEKMEGNQDLYDVAKDIFG